MTLKIPLEERIAKQKDRIDRNFYYVGIDGCRGGWIAAAICNGNLDIYKFDSLNEVWKEVAYSGKRPDHRFTIVLIIIIMLAQL